MEETKFQWPSVTDFDVITNSYLLICGGDVVKIQRDRHNVAKINDTTNCKAFKHHCILFNLVCCPVVENVSQNWALKIIRDEKNFCGQSWRNESKLPEMFGSGFIFVTAKYQEWPTFSYLTVA